MNEEHYIIKERNDNEKILIIEKKFFGYRSEEAKSASFEEAKIIILSKIGKFSIHCNGEIMQLSQLNFSSETIQIAKQMEEEYQRNKFKSEKIEKEKRIEEIRKKDLLELTEEEIELLAHANIKPRYSGGGALYKGTTYESEYRDLMKKIDEKRKNLEKPENLTMDDNLNPNSINNMNTNEYTSEELEEYKKMLSSIPTDSIPVNDIDLSTIPEDINTIKKH